MEDLKNIIATNIIKLRKEKNWTQAELAEQLNYSDKSISKWERGESIPDIVILKQLSDLFVVPIDYFITSHNENEKMIIVNNKKKSKHNKLYVTLVSVSPIWIISALIFVLVDIFAHIQIWFVFYISVPLTLIMFIIFNTIWGVKKRNYIFVSLLVWSILFAIYLSFINQNLWQILSLGFLAQLVIFFWSRIKKD